MKVIHGQGKSMLIPLWSLGESSIQALGSIGKWIIEQEMPRFGSCEKERHTLPMP